MTLHRSLIVMALPLVATVGCGQWPGYVTPEEPTPTRTAGPRAGAADMELRTPGDGGPVPVSSDSGIAIPPLDGGTTSCVTPPSGIVSWWSADKTATDAVGGNDGTLEGNVTYIAGAVGGAFFFDGNSDVATPTTGLPAGSNDRTVEAWVYLESLGSGPTQMTIFDYGHLGSTGDAFELLTLGSPELVFSQWGDDVSGGTMTTGVWTHVAVVASSGVVTLYVGGVGVASGTPSFSTPGGSRLYIGGPGAGPDGGTFHLAGAVDELTVYDRALTSAEIAGIASAGSAGKCH